MLRLYRRLTITGKLLIATLAMLIPLSTLAFFMDISFRYDINIGRMELTGTRHLREAFIIQHALTSIRTDRLAQQLDKNKTSVLETRHGVPVQEVETCLKRLETFQSTISQGDMKPLACVDLQRMQESWQWYRSTGSPEAFDSAYRASQALIHDIANCANLALDPALDSQMLARAAVSALPESCEFVARMQWMALELIRDNPPHQMVRLNADQRDELVSEATVFTTILKRILDDSTLALAEDPNFYTQSPTLALKYGTLVERYQTMAANLLEVVDRFREGNGSPAGLYNAAARVNSTGSRLFMTAMDELDILVTKRIEGYQTWRQAGIWLSLAGFLCATGLFLAASRSITRGVKSVVQYTNRVASGEYDAEPDLSDLGPGMRNMVRDTESMVADLKNKIGYLKGILQGISVPCYVVDRDEKVTFLNQPYLDLYEHDGLPENYLGMDLATLHYGKPDRETVTGRAMRTGIPITTEFDNSFTHKGNLLHVRLNVAPLFNLDNALIGAFGVITDLTDIIEKEKAIERLAAFPREAPDPVLSAAPDGSILYLNTSASVVFETSGLAPDQNFLPERHTEIVASCLASGSSRHGIESSVGNQHFSWTYHPLPGQDIVHMYATDITKRIRAEEQLLHDAFHDSLTGLPNKALFMDRVTQALQRAKLRDKKMAVLFMDLDGFKNINDGLGHSVGDKLLSRFAWRIQKLLGQDETLARMSGDEFTVLLPNISDRSQSVKTADRIQSELRRPFAIDGQDLFISASVGVVNGPEGNMDAEDILRDAETAMYRAKASGRARAEVFDSTMHEDASERIQLENDLKKAMDNGEFEPYYQPIISLADGSISGFEALIRWNHPTQGIVSPGRFIPIAEETGLINEMGRFMLEAACLQTKAWQERYPSHHQLTISVNLSVVQMTRPDIGDQIRTILDYTGIPTNTVKIEITESGLMNNVGSANDLLSGLEKIGVSLMIDDFGTGYSSLSHLHQFPFHYLKIDQSFVSTMEDKPDNMEIVRTIVSLAHTLGKKVVAEGVETQSQRAQLKQLGCELVQGFLFSQPLPAHKAEALLANNTRW